jgi:hypothetical protein
MFVVSNQDCLKIAYSLKKDKSHVSRIWFKEAGIQPIKLLLCKYLYVRSDLLTDGLSCSEHQVPEGYDRIIGFPAID